MSQLTPAGGLLPLATVLPALAYPLVVSEGEDAPSTTNRGLSRVMAKAVMESLKGLGKLGIICDQNENHYQKLLDKLKQEKI